MANRICAHENFDEEQYFQLIPLSLSLSDSVFNESKCDPIARRSNGHLTSLRNIASSKFCVVYSLKSRVSRRAS